MKEDFSKKSVAELKEIAKKEKIKGYYKMRKAELVGLLSEHFDEDVERAAQELRDSIDEAVRAAENLVEEVVEEIIEEASEIAEGASEVAEDLAEAVSEIFEPEEEEEDNDLPAELYPQLGDVIRYSDHTTRMVVHAEYLRGANGDIESANIWTTNGVTKCLNKKGRQEYTIAVTGGDILFWPPENFVAVYRYGEKILPQEIAPAKKWWQFWKWFSK